MTDTTSVLTCVPHVLHSLLRLLFLTHSGLSKEAPRQLAPASLTQSQTCWYVCVKRAIQGKDCLSLRRKLFSLNDAIGRFVCNMHEALEVRNMQPEESGCAMAEH